ncbi:hypothetical protein LCGC14_2687720 [marine sediment metagenome]|uniref:Uncharacterized protein n=1 Tax=marine sediment metagenome TaxID=412755 RepID=A0A0F8VAV3_9ZZZZ
MSMGSNGITIRNGYFFGDSHDKRALETLKENGNALIPNFERFFSSIPPEESLNGNVQRPDYEAFSPIPPE